MNVLGARYNPKLGIIISSSVFGLMHLLNPNISAIAVINIILVGIFLILYVIKTGDLWGVCGLHYAWNWTKGNVFGFDVNRNELNLESLIKLSSKNINTLWPDEYRYLIEAVETAGIDDMKFIVDYFVNNQNQIIQNKIKMESIRIKKDDLDMRVDYNIASDYKNIGEEIKIDPPADFNK